MTANHISETIRNGKPVPRLLAGLPVFFLIAGVCLGQSDSWHSCTLNAGAGWSVLTGNEKNSLNSGYNLFDAGGGFALSKAPSTDRKWVVFVTANFALSQMRIKNQALTTAQSQNPQEPALLDATGGHAKVYTATLDPTIRWPHGWGSAYVFGGFGWMRRSLEFTGPSGQGALLEPTSPVVFGTGGNSGAFDAGGGMNFKLGEHFGAFTPYAEARIVHGLAINHAMTFLSVSGGIRW